MVFNGAIDHIIQNNPKAKQNPRGLSQLDGYKRGLVNSLTGNLQKFGLERVPKVETLEELLQDDETSENSTQDCPETKPRRSSERALRLWTLTDRKAGASEPETPIIQCQRPAHGGTITRSFLNPADAGENGSLSECL